MIDDPVAVDVLADRDDVAGVVARYNLLAVPVVDDERRLVGIVTVDDAIDTILPASWRRRGTHAGDPELGDRCGSARTRLRARLSPRGTPPPARTVPRPSRAGRVPRRHGPGPDRRDRRQRRRRHHDLQRHGRLDRADPAVDLPDHDRHPGHRPGDGGAARCRHRPGPVGPHPRPVRRAPDGVRDGHPAGRQRGQHRRRVLRGGGRAGDLRDLALPRGAGRRASPSGRSSSRPAIGRSSASS